MKRKELKMLIELAQNFEEADGLIEMYSDFRTTKEKIAFILSNFFFSLFIVINQFWQRYQHPCLSFINVKTFFSRLSIICHWNTNKQK